MKLKLLTTLLALGISISSFAEENKPLNIITDRSDVHLLDLVEKFRQESNVDVNLTFVKDGIIEKAKNGEFDLMISKDSSELVAASDDLKSMNDYLLHDLPYNFYDMKDKKWFLMSYRIRSFHVKNTVKDVPESYEDLAKPQYKGRLCIRSLTHNYNLELFGTMLNYMGEEKFTEWFKAFKGNLAKEPSGHDRNQVKAVFEGECEIAIANSYYRGLMMQDQTQKKWAEATTMYIPNQKSIGAIALYAGVGKLTDNFNNESFLKYLVRNDVQQSISNNNFEYPIKSENSSEVVKTFGKEQGLDSNTIKLYPNIQNDLFELRKKAYLIVKENSK